VVETVPQSPKNTQLSNGSNDTKDLSSINSSSSEIINNQTLASSIGINSAVTVSSDADLIVIDPQTTESAGIISGSQASQKVDGKELSEQTEKKTVPVSTETKVTPISIKRRELKPTTKPVNFEFEVSPDQISWDKTGSLNVSPTFMTNEQPVIYSHATQPVLNMSGILFDSIHNPNQTDSSQELTALERLLSVDSDNFSPRVYDVFADTRKYGTYVISSLKITEPRRTTDGKPSRIVADLSLQPVPTFQIRTSQDLAMIPEVLPVITVATAASGTGSTTSTATAGGCLVTKGTVVSFTGHTGRVFGVDGSKGDHVHLERKVNKQNTDPRPDADLFSVSGKPLSTYINLGKGSVYGGREGKHLGQDYGQGITEGMPISVNQDTKLTFEGSQPDGAGNYWKCVVGDVEYSLFHNSKINKELFKCDMASTTSTNSGNKGGNVAATTITS
jgi:hypothetical protein